MEGMNPRGGNEEEMDKGERDDDQLVESDVRQHERGRGQGQGRGGEGLKWRG